MGVAVDWISAAVRSLDLTADVLYPISPERCCTLFTYIIFFVCVKFSGIGTMVVNTIIYGL